MLSHMFKWIAAKFLAIGNWLEPKQIQEPAPAPEPDIVDIVADAIDKDNQKRAGERVARAKATERRDKEREVTLSVVDAAALSGGIITDEMAKKYVEMFYEAYRSEHNKTLSEVDVPPGLGFYDKKAMRIIRGPDSPINFDDEELFEIVRTTNEDIPKPSDYGPAYGDEEPKSRPYDMKPLREQEVNKVKVRKIASKGRGIHKVVSKIAR